MHSNKIKEEIPATTPSHYTAFKRQVLTQLTVFMAPNLGPKSLWVKGTVPIQYKDTI